MTEHPFDRVPFLRIEIKEIRVTGQTPVIKLRFTETSVQVVARNVPRHLVPEALRRVAASVEASLLDEQVQEVVLGPRNGVWAGTEKPPAL